ncbi:MAG: hypothetical protein V8R40_13660 [Dysosmobacter sp.]
MAVRAATSHRNGCCLNSARPALSRVTHGGECAGCLGQLRRVIQLQGNFHMVFDMGH